MSRFKQSGSAKALTHAALLVAGLSLTACAAEETPEPALAPKVSVEADSIQQRALLANTTTVQMDATLRVVTLAQLLGADYASVNLTSFELVDATSDRGVALTYDATEETVTFGASAIDVWDRIAFKYCSLADPADCTERDAHVVIVDTNNVCAPEAVSEDFRNSVLKNDWILGQTARLTAALPLGADPEGEGWLRLSNLQKYSYSDALLNVAFASSQGVSMRFESAQWGAVESAKPGDGITFFLVDGDKISLPNPNAPITNLPPTNPDSPIGEWTYDSTIDDSDTNLMFRAGAPGGSLGYAQRKTSNGFMPGLKHGVIGVGFDASGYYSTSTEGKVGGLSSTIALNAISLRGNAASEWMYLASTGTITGAELGCTASRNGIASCDTERPTEIGEGRYNSIVNIDPIDASSYRVTVYTQNDAAGGFVERINHVVTQPLPENLKLGFTGSSGGAAMNYNEIRNVAIEVFADLGIELDVDSLTASGKYPTGEDVTLTYTISNNLASTVCAAEVDLQFPAGFVATAQSCNASAGGPDATCGDFDTLGVNRDYVALGANGKTVITVTGRFTHTNDDDVAVSGRVTPGAGQGDKNPLDNFATVTGKIGSAPLLDDQTLNVIPGTPNTIDILAGSTPGNTPTVASTSVITSTLPTGVVATLVDGNLTVTLPANATDPVTITVQVKNEDGLLSEPATITVVPNFAPVVPTKETWVTVGEPSVDVTVESSDSPFTVAITGPPTNAQATVTGDTVTVTPNDPSEPGTYVVDLNVCDTVPDVALCTTSTVTVVYNDLPTVNGGQVAVPAGGTAELPLVTSPGTIGTIDTTELINPPAASLGVCAIDNGKVTFVANANAASGQTAVCTVEVCEEKPANHCSDAAFSFDIVGAFAPKADSIAGAQGATSTVPVTTLLSNDGNVTPGSFSLVPGSAVGGSVSATGGNVSFDTDGSATSGSFQYNVCAGYDVTVCETVTVTVNVTGKPVATPTEGWTLPATPVTVTTPFNVPTTTTPNGTVTGGTAVPAPNGGITVTPDPGFIGEIVVPVEGCTLTTPAACETTTVTVFVNDLPTMNDESRIVAPGQTQSVTPNADEGDLGTIDSSSLSLVTAGSTQAQGTCSIESGQVRYVANANAAVGQTDICVVKICEEKPADACVTAKFSFEIDASFNASDDDFATTENVDLDVKTSVLLSNDGGTDDSTFTLIGTPDADGAYPTSEGGLLVPNDDNDGYIYSPAEDFVGDDTFQYKVCSAFDATICDDVTVTVFVNDLPTMEDDRRLVAPGQTATLTPDVDEGAVGAINWNSLTITPDTNATEGICDVVSGQVTYTANAGAMAGITDTCIVEVCEVRPNDACVVANFEFTISASFDPTDDELVTTKDVPVDFKINDLLINDGGTVEESFTLVGTPDAEGVITTPEGGSLVPNEDGDGYTYIPAEDFTGEDTFTYTVCSAFDDTVCETVSVTVTVKNEPLADDPTKWVVTGTPDVDIDLEDSFVGDDPIDSVTVVSVGPADEDDNSPGTVTVTGGVITFVPNDPSAPGIYEVVVDVCDADDVCTEVTVTIVYNDPPTAGTPSVKIPEGNEGDFTIPLNGIISGTTPGEIDGGWDKTSVAVSNDPNGPFGVGPAELEVDGASCAIVDGALVYTGAEAPLPTCFVQVCELNPGPAGIDATDRACTVIELTPEYGIFEPVKITGPADNSQTEDKTPTVTGTGEPNTEVTITVGGNIVGTVPVDEDGNWTWTPDEDLEEGPHTIKVTGTDGSEDEITITITSGDPVVPGKDDVVITGPADNSETGDKTPTVTGTGQPNTNVTITVDGKEAGTVPVNENGDWAWTPTKDLDDGKHIIVAKGENGSEAQITLTIKSDQVPDTVGLVVSGGQAFGCSSTGGNAPAPLMLAIFVGLGLIVRRRTSARR